ncbi:hypothetical protein THAOC_18345 [Thalassiosira oceanica]|uniref:C2H2-type domain-containing protein n=1 Tax=Thalassiosira oceanica TaxID=159749 RepID=K0S599_THAOC|nr:hypothetical protein THAOC_18345 [Thalassiosira oceanica]|eukprot:EJK61208.1 hypothetical protein THAOC_18345 [Thalassiosira oceanica]
MGKRQYTLGEVVGDRVISILEQHGRAGIELSQLQNLYKKTYGKKLIFHRNLKSCVNSLNGVEVDRNNRAWLVNEHSKIEQTVGDRVISILKRHGTGIEFTELLKLYQKNHGKKLVYRGKLATALKNLNCVSVEGVRAWFVDEHVTASPNINLPETHFRCVVCSKVYFSESEYKQHLCSQGHVNRVASLVSAGWVSPVDFASHRHHGGPDGRLEDDMLPDITFTVIESVDGMSNTQTINSAELSSVTFYSCPEEEEPDQNSGNENEINESQTKQVRKNPDCAPVDDIEMQDVDVACERSEQPDASEEYDRRSKTPQQQQTGSTVVPIRCRMDSNKSDVHERRRNIECSSFSIHYPLGNRMGKLTNVVLIALQ